MYVTRHGMGTDASPRRYAIKRDSWYYVYFSGQYSDMYQLGTGEWFSGADICRGTVWGIVAAAEQSERIGRERYFGGFAPPDAPRETWLRYYVFSEDDNAWIIEDVDASQLQNADFIASKVDCPPEPNPLEYATLPNAPKPPIGRPKPTAAMAKQMAASRAKLKALAKPSGGTAADTGAGSKLPWVAVGIGAAIVGGVGLLWWADRRRS